jgi:hypothetical protein
MIKVTNGDMAQLGERCLRKAEATGSTPVISTKMIKKPGNTTFSGFLFFAIVQIRCFLAFEMSRRLRVGLIVFPNVEVTQVRFKKSTDAQINYSFDFLIAKYRTVTPVDTEMTSSIS